MTIGVIKNSSGWNQTPNSRRFIGSHPKYLLTHCSPSSLTQISTDNRSINKGMAQVDEAMRLIIEFFTASVYGYMHQCSAIRRVRESRPRHRQTRRRKAVNR